jgi:hypothetical protein
MAAGIAAASHPSRSNSGSGRARQGKDRSALQSTISTSLPTFNSQPTSKSVQVRLEQPFGRRNDPPSLRWQIPPGGQRLGVSPGVRYGTAGSNGEVSRSVMRRLATWTAEWLERAAGGAGGAGGASDRSRCTRHQVGVVLLAWDPAPARRAARELASHLGSVAPRAQLVLVDNRGTGMDWAGEEGFELVPGDNSAREFSGLQRGIDHVLASGIPSCWILANDRYDRYQSYRQSLLPLVDGGTLDAVLATGALAGRINGYPTPSKAFGLTIDSWACSNFLVVASRSLARLGDLVTIGTSELASVVNHSVAEGPLLRTDGPLDDALIAYLTEWLTGDGTTLTDHWYRHQPATADSWDDLCGKVQSILNEQLLSAKARRAGIPVLPLASAYTLGRFEPTSLSYRLLAASVRALPRRSPRLLGGLAGRNLVAMHRWRSAVPATDRSSTGPPQRRGDASLGLRDGKSG